MSPTTKDCLHVLGIGLPQRFSVRRFICSNLEHVCNNIAMGNLYAFLHGQQSQPLLTQERVLHTGKPDVPDE